jgi:DNA-binding response OmpR family regulator
LVEDDRDLAATIEDYLVQRGWLVSFAPNGARALASLLERSFATVVLDHRMPGLTGLELCRRVRAEVAPTLPILMVTAADALEDRLAGFAAGVDDYLVKPFALPELHARLVALVRRADRSLTARRMAFEDVEMDLDERVVQRGRRRLELTRTGFTILEMLIRRVPAVVRREELERHLWGDELPGSDVLRSHIYALRSALDGPGETPLLQTHRGVGYQLRRRDAR